MQDFVGKHIDRYRVIERLGMGGMAVVYKAYDTRLERDVALKLIRSEAIPAEQHDRLLKRFEREAKAQARFNHYHIMPVYDYGKIENIPYLVMAYISGDTLKARAGKPVPYQLAFRWVIPIADALAYAHKMGVVHRDVKPSNILFNDQEQPVLSDFGIAKLLETDEATLTGTGIGVGTPEYMAPEQWRGQATPATDQYALGVILYELLTGQKPYSADTPAEIILIQATEPLRGPRQLVPDIPESVENLLYKILAFKPEDRYENMYTLSEALKNLVDLVKPSPIVDSAQLTSNSPNKEHLYDPLFSETVDLIYGDLNGEDNDATRDGYQEKRPLEGLKSSFSSTNLHDDDFIMDGFDPVLGDDLLPPKLNEVENEISLSDKLDPTQDSALSSTSVEPGQDDGLQSSSSDLGTSDYFSSSRLKRVSYEDFLSPSLSSVQSGEPPQGNFGLKQSDKFSPGNLNQTYDGDLLAAQTEEIPSISLESENQPKIETQLVSLTEASSIESLQIDYANKATLVESVKSITSPYEIGSILTNTTDGAKMVYVPAGDFIMGSKGKDAYDDEKPQHIVFLDSYWIDMHLVTNARYRKCVEAGFCKKPENTFFFDTPDYDHHPVVLVSWKDADAYCKWAGGRLPTEAEWEKAARGIDGRTYPWGNDKPSCDIVNFNYCAGGTTAVGSYPNGASFYGALDMAGNVWEWVADWYDENYYSKSPDKNPLGLLKGSYRVVRGGSWINPQRDIRSSYRYWVEPCHGYDLISFRCVRSDYS